MGYIEFQHVSKTYPNGTLALHDVSFSIEEGEFAFLIGESGAGKSTVFRLLTREEDPSQGQVFLDGCDLASLKANQIPFLRRGIGMIFQDFRLIDSLTVGENVALAMEIIGESPRRVRQRVPLVLSVVGLRRKINDYPTELSGGEQQRVCIARALVNRPRLIIADEPTGDLDPVNGEAIMALLDRINRENGTTVITCTHDREIVDRMNKRVIEICDGLLVRDDARGYYILESERKNAFMSRAACSNQQREAAQAIKEEMEEGQDALQYFRQDADDKELDKRVSDRVNRMRQTAQRQDFFDHMSRTASLRRNRPPAQERAKAPVESREAGERVRGTTGRIPRIRLREEPLEAIKEEEDQG